MGSLLLLTEDHERRLPDDTAHFLWIDNGRVQASPNPPNREQVLGYLVSNFGFWWFFPVPGRIPSELRINGRPAGEDLQLRTDRVQVHVTVSASTTRRMPDPDGDTAVPAIEPRTSWRDEPSSAVARLLLTTERFRGEWRMHWIFMVKRVALVLAYVALSILAVRNWIEPRYVGWAVLSAVVVGAAVVGWQIFPWLTSRLVLTSDRILFFGGTTGPRVSMIKVQHVTGLSYAQTALGRRLNYGSFQIESAGRRSGMTTFSDLPDPGSLYRRLTEELYAQDEAGRIGDVVSEAVERTLGPAQVPDIEGRISARWERGDTGTWQIAVTVRTGREQRLQQAAPDSRPFRLAGGDQRERTNVVVSLDLPGHVVDLGDDDVPIDTEGGVHTWIGRVDPPALEPVEAWVTLFTYGRFLQSIPVGEEGALALPEGGAAP